MATRIERISVVPGLAGAALPALSWRAVAVAILLGVALAVWMAWLPGSGPFGSAGATVAVASVPFVPQGLAVTRTAAELYDHPARGAALVGLAPGTRLSVGGIVHVPAGLWRREVLWVRVEAGGAALYGFVSAEAAVMAMGAPPVLDLGAVAVEQLLAPLDGFGAAGSSAGVAGSVSAAMAAPASGDVTIAWLPETVARWRPHILASAAEHGVDPNLVAIVILVESGGNPNAVSPSGASGLMQVMPTTAMDIVSRRGLSGHETAKLFEPAYNIDLGTWYLAEMLRTFGSADDPDWQQSVELAAAAYNGGPGTVQAFLRSGRTLPAESSRYRRFVGAMWSERGGDGSAGFDAWMAAGGAHLVESARGVGEA